MISGDKGDTAEYDDTEIKQRISNAEDDIDNLETTVARHTTEIAEKQPIGDYALRSEIPNLDGYVKDLSYVHTDNNYTTVEKNKLERVRADKNATTATVRNSPHKRNNILLNEYPYAIRIPISVLLIYIWDTIKIAVPMAPKISITREKIIQLLFSFILSS